jgi:hypothetical protein
LSLQRKNPLTSTIKGKYSAQALLYKVVIFLNLIDGGMAAGCGPPGLSKPGPDKEKMTRQTMIQVTKLSFGSGLRVIL